jgi:pyridoxine 5-phosphate synthase
MKTIPELEEVSIGHALVSRAVFVGFQRAVEEYLAVLR